MEKDKLEKAYKEIIGVLKKYQDICVFDVKELEEKAGNHLFGLTLKEDYGFDITPENIHSRDYIRFGDYKAVGQWGEKYRRTVSWSDDGTQPEDELLFSVCFPTGAYIFGEDYPSEFFQQFFQELKGLNPKFVESTNHCLYWSMENAGMAFNAFDNLLKKYRELNQADIKERKIKKMREELEKLEGSSY